MEWIIDRFIINWKIYEVDIYFKFWNFNLINPPSSFSLMILDGNNHMIYLLIIIISILIKFIFQFNP
jgi:hypothetical protein